MKLRFIFSEVGKGLSRNRAMSVAVILVTFVSLLFVGIAGLTQMQVSKMKSEWYDKIEVTIYMCAINDAPRTATRPRRATHRSTRCGRSWRPPR